MKEKEILTIINETKKVLDSGGTILYPTDTIWGLGCNAINKEAIKKIYTIKDRSQNKPFILLFNNMKTLSNYVKKIPDIAQNILNKNNRPTTIIYQDPINLPDILIYKKTIAARIIKKGNLKLLLQYFQKPITSTSANISGQKMINSIDEIDQSVKRKVDYIIPEKFNKFDKENIASRIIRINNNSTIEILRK
jgi:L-threonylcarbamoyladenylate synthase